MLVTLAKYRAAGSTFYPMQICTSGPGESFHGEDFRDALKMLFVSRNERIIKDVV